MGLDMYAMATKEQLDDVVDFKAEDSQEFYYWRKHPNLHGWMEQLYYNKGGTQDFNCVPVALNLSDLDRLESDIKSYQLPATEGFFFGQTQGDEQAGDLELVAKARDIIGQGYTVFYDSWW
ncbi:phosphoglycerate kinase [Novipirellula rosea]|uniref:Phosphoglycerate kinase n=1 Tax=Novipirellula rosea TaxID=1031540 RepID=A0ABP8NDQ8_9BACT